MTQNTIDQLFTAIIDLYKQLRDSPIEYGCLFNDGSVQVTFIRQIGSTDIICRLEIIEHEPYSS